MLPLGFRGGGEGEEGLTGGEEVLICGLEGVRAGRRMFGVRGGGVLRECYCCPAEGWEGVLVFWEDEGEGRGG